MEQKMTFLELAKTVLEKERAPLTVEEIRDISKQYNIFSKVGSKGKTPERSIGAQIYTDIKNNGDNSVFIQVSKSPVRFYLRNMQDASNNIEKLIEKKETEPVQKSQYKERDLHPLLVKFLDSDSHFRCQSKTIFHEKSLKRLKGVNEWLHPDLVGVYFPYMEYSTHTLDLQNNLKVNSIKLYSFELKIEINYSNIRQCYFQAVSNSSWANEGYLVGLNVSDDPDFINELQRLSNAFGIGIIRLNKENILESEMLFPARKNEIIDWDTVNRIVEDSPDFSSFISNIIEDIKLNKIKSNYDKVLNDDEYEKYIKEKKII